MLESEGFFIEVQDGNSIKRSMLLDSSSLRRTLSPLHSCFP